MQYYFARGSSGGGHASVSHSSSSSSRSSSSSSVRSGSSSSKSTSSKSTTSKPSAPKVGKSTAKPGATIKSGSTTVKSSTAKPANIKNARSTGIVGDNGYTPRFSGYTAPAGSVVYYPQHSALDYLPWIYLFSNSSPHNDQATIVQPDNKQVTAPPQKGVDGMFIFNWILFIVILIALVVGIVYGVNKFTSKRSQANAAI